jgi:hypothetical protein
MGTDRFLPLEAATADALLDGRGDGPPELVALLARATAPCHPVELGGEAVAVAHLRATRSALTSPHPPASRRGALTRVLTVKAAAAAVAVLAVGGVAIAATVGASPPGIGDSGGGAAIGPGGTRVDSAGPRQTAGVSPSPAASTSAAASAAESKSLRGLCAAYLKAVAKNPGKALQNKAFAKLITAAGGADQVPQFCADLLADPAATPSPHGTTPIRR